MSKFTTEELEQAVLEGFEETGHWERAAFVGATDVSTLSDKTLEKMRTRLSVDFQNANPDKRKMEKGMIGGALLKVERELDNRDAAKGFFPPPKPKA